MKRLSAPRYLVASVLLLAALTGFLAISSARRTQEELAGQLEAKGLALAEAVEIASRSAIRGNALMEEMIAQRLLDNARLIDRLLGSRPVDVHALADIRDANQLRRIDLLDREGRPYTPPPPPRGMMMGPMAGSRMQEMPEPHREMMRYFWGRRWGQAPPEGADTGPPAIRDRRFWEGTVFGVAIAAHSFPGLIAVHADAAYVLHFRKEIGVERQIEDLGRQPGVEAVALFSPDLVVLAHSDPRQIGERDADDLVRQALAEARGLTRVATRPGGDQILGIVRPLTLDGSRLGVLRIDVSMAPLQEAWRRDRRAAVLLGLSVLLLGGLGMAVIFYTQSRHLREVRALEVEVERRERLSALGNLAAVVGHEVRNPLNAISMGLQRLRTEYQPAGGDAEYARVMDLMRDEIKRLNGIVEEFLSLARPFPLRPVAVHPAELLHEVAALVEAEARARRVQLSVEASADIGVAQLDRDHMKQVLLNLVKNGLEAMPKGGRLILAGSSSKEMLELSVEDTGEGIPADLLPRLFEPYVTTKTQGVGLGLAIARRIVEGHGGEIDVQSRPGHGTRVVITIPLDRQPPARRG
jgi:signal transduction histidine kinase